MAAIDPKTCAVLALSMTPESMAGYPNAGEMLQKTARIMAAARRASIPVIHGVVGFREGYPEVGEESMFQGLKRAGRSREDSPGIAPHPEAEGRSVLSIARAEAEWPAAAVWNFPLGRRGRLRLKVRANAGFGGALVLLTDHFSVPFEPEDALYELFGLWLKPGQEPAEASSGGIPERGVQAGTPRSLPPGVLRHRLNGGGWRQLELRWDCDERTCTVGVDGVSAGCASLLREGDGVCYVRLKSASNAVDGGFLVEAVEVEVEG